MRKPALLSTMAFLMLAPLGALAGQDAVSIQPRANMDATKAAKKAIGISGTVSDDGRTFTADKDGRIWMVSNPEALSGIAERHVKVRAHMNLSGSQIEVVSVSVIAEEPDGIRYGDAAFRR
jgi:hypothetical protein